MARKHYRIITIFTYKSGLTGGRLDKVVKAKTHVALQIESNREWLKAKGHTEVETTVTEASRD